MNSPEEKFRDLYPNEAVPDLAYQRVAVAPKFSERVTKPAFVPLHKLVGTNHPRYYERTWMQALENLKRDKYDAERVKTIDYWILNKFKDGRGVMSRFPVQVLYIEEDDKYYTLAGNHRMILVKLRGDESVCIKNVIHAWKELPAPELPPVEVRVDPQPTWLEDLILSGLARIAGLFRGRN